MDGRLAAVRAEMEQRHLEQDDNVAGLRAEIVRLAEREKEALQRAQYAEMSRKSEKYRTPMQAWAVARLWGIGQARSR